MKKITAFFKLFVLEFVTNSIVCYIPSIVIRNYYYRRVCKIKMNKTVNIQMKCYIYNSSGDFLIGDNTVINRRCTLDRRGGLHIGKNVNISAESAIYTAGHILDSPTFADYLKPVVIGDHSWIGTRAIIMPGVEIGIGAVVLPGSIVTRNVPALHIVGGAPAKFLKERGLTFDQLKYNPAWYPLFQ